MRVVVTLEMNDNNKLTSEQIERDIRMTEDSIGWDYYYRIASVDVVKDDDSDYCAQMNYHDHCSMDVDYVMGHVEDE